MGATSTAIAGLHWVAGDSNGLDACPIPLLGGGASSTELGFGSAGHFRDVMLSTAQTLYLMVDGGGDPGVGRLSITGFTF